MYVVPKNQQKADIFICKSRVYNWKTKINS